MAGLNNLGHLQDVEHIIGAPHLRNCARRVKVIVNPVYDLVFGDARVMFDQANRQESKLCHLTVILGDERAFVQLLDLKHVPVHGTLRFCLILDLLRYILIKI